MASSKTILIPILVEQFLNQYSDESHPISVSEIEKKLEEMNITTDRRVIYNAMKALKECGYRIHKVIRDHRTGYYIEHTFNKEEIFLLNNEIASSSALSLHEFVGLQEKLVSLLSSQQASSLPEVYPSVSAKNSSLLSSIRLLLDAIAGYHPVSFRYFDLGVDQTKIYRINIYVMVPYAIVSEGGRFYCIFHSEKHNSFGNYRIDKMDSIEIMEETAKTYPFSLKDHLRSSFQMYHGTGQTVTCKIDKSFASYIYDRFSSQNIIISSVDDKTFTVSLRTAITPTLISWLMQFSMYVTVLGPDEVINEMIDSSRQIIQKYQKKEGKNDE